MGALSLTSSKARQKEKFGPLVPMTAHVPFGSVKDIENVLFRYQMAPAEVAAIFVEAIQGEGGYVIAADGFLKDLRALCDKHGILMVCDEIQSGTGRTGKWFAYEHFGVVPDITVVSKGLASGMPLGAVIASKGIMDWPPGKGTTFGGNPVCCALPSPRSILSRKNTWPTLRRWARFFSPNWQTSRRSTNRSRTPAAWV